MTLLSLNRSVAAHRDYVLASENLKQQLLIDLEALKKRDVDLLLAERYQKIMAFGYC